MRMPSHTHDVNLGQLYEQVCNPLQSPSWVVLGGLAPVPLNPPTPLNPLNPLRGWCTGNVNGPGVSLAWESDKWLQYRIFCKPTANPAGKIYNDFQALIGPRHRSRIVTKLVMPTSPVKIFITLYRFILDT